MLDSSNIIERSKHQARNTYFKLITLLFLFLNLTKQNNQNDNPIKEIKLGEIVNINWKYNQKNEENFQQSEQIAAQLYFKIDKFIPNQDILILLLSQKDIFNRPILYYSTDSNQPSENNDKDIFCGLKGVDICTIESNKVKINKQKFYLKVNCIADCEFDLKVNYYQPKSLRLGEQHLLNFQTTTPQIFQIHIPAQSEKDFQEQNFFSQILIEAFLQNPFEASSNFKINGNSGRILEPNSTNFDYSGYSIWKNGQSIKILSYDPLSKWDAFQNTIFTFMIEAEINSKITLIANIYKLTRQIDLNQDIIDTISADDYMTYELSIPPSYYLQPDTKEEILLRFEIEPYLGIPDIFINFQTKPDLLDQSQWQLSLQNNEEEDDNNDGHASQVINYSELIKNSTSNLTQIADNKFYLFVYAKSSTSFRLKVSVISDKTTFNIINFDSVEAGYLQQKEQQNYLLQFYPQVQTKLQIKMFTLTGKAAIYVILCPDIQNIENCILSQKDINQRDSLTRNGFLYYSEDKHYNTLNFSTNLDLCTNICYLSIAVISLVEDSSKNVHYRLVAKHDNSVIDLKENQLYKSYLQQGEKEFFKFELLTFGDSKMEKVSIQIQVISGTLVSFYSSKNNHPSLLDYEITKTNDFQNYNFDINSDENQLNQKKQFFISVEPTVASSYTIQVKIQRQDSNNGYYSKYDQIQKMKLHFGIPQTGLLFNGQTVEKYYFILPLEENYPQNKTNIIIYFDTLNESNYNKVFVNSMPLVKIYHSFKHYLDEFQESVTITKSQNTSQFLYFEIFTNFTNPGKYVIELQFDDNQNTGVIIKYMISINQDDILQLASEQGFIKELKSGDRDNFEIYLSQPSQLFFELFDCYGKFEVFGAKSYEDIEERNYSIQQIKVGGTRRINYHSLITYNITDLQYFYFSVQSKDNLGFLNQSNLDHESLYMIKAHILKPNEINPYDVFYAPYDQTNSTVISVDHLHNNSYSITFKPIQIDEFQIIPYKIMEEQYILHISDSSDILPLYSKCNIDDSNLEGLFLQGDLQKPFHQKQSSKFLSNNNNNYKIDNIYNFQLQNMPLTDLHLQIHSLINILNIQNNISQTLTFLYDPVSIKYVELTTQILNNTADPDLFAKNNQEAQQQENLINSQKNQNSQENFVFIISLIIGGIIALIFVAYQISKYRKGSNLLPQQIELGEKVQASDLQKPQNFVILPTISNRQDDNSRIQDLSAIKFTDTSLFNKQQFTKFKEQDTHAQHEYEDDQQNKDNN